MKSFGNWVAVFIGIVTIWKAVTIIFDIIMNGSLVATIYGIRNLRMLLICCTSITSLLVTAEKFMDKKKKKTTDVEMNQIIQQQPQLYPELKVTNEK